MRQGPVDSQKQESKITMKWNRLAGLCVFGCLFCGALTPGMLFSASNTIPHSQSDQTLTFQEPVDLYPIHTDEMELLAIVNREREQYGLKPLELDDALMRLARDHSREMARQGFISHDQPSGNLQTRMGRAGYHYDVAKENVASSQSVTRAHKALLNSPPHKRNILSPDVTHIGVGIVQTPSSCGQLLYITQLFTAPRKEYLPEMVQSILEDRISDLQETGHGSIDPDPLLEKLASRSLLSLKTPYDRTVLQNLLAASASELQQNGENGLSQLEVSVQVLHDPNNLTIPPSKREGRARKYGAAVRQITDNRNQPAFLVLTLLGITR